MKISQKGTMKQEPNYIYILGSQDLLYAYKDKECTQKFTKEELKKLFNTFLLICVIDDTGQEGYVDDVSYLSVLSLKDYETYCTIEWQMFTLYSSEYVEESTT